MKIGGTLSKLEQVISGELGKKETYAGKIHHGSEDNDP